MSESDVIAAARALMARGVPWPKEWDKWCWYCQRRPDSHTDECEYAALERALKALDEAKRSNSRL